MNNFPKAFRVFSAVLYVLLFLNPGRSDAHEIRPAYLQIVQTSESSYDVFWKVPRMGDAVPRIQPVFPSGFVLEVLKNPKQTPEAAIYSYRLQSTDPLQGKEIYIKGLNKTLIDVLVNVSFINGEKSYASITGRSGSRNDPR